MENVDKNKISEKDFCATTTQFWKKHYGYNDDDADKASDWMSRHYSDLEEESDDNKNDNNLKKVVKLNESILKQIVAECLNGVMGINEVGETTVGQKRLGALSAKREKQALKAKKDGDNKKFKDNMKRSIDAFVYARDKSETSDSDKREMDKAFRHGEKIGKRKKIDENHLTNVISNVVCESLKSYLKEECDTQELCNMINQIFKSVRLKYRMQEYEEVFKTAINNGCSKQDLIAAFGKCNLDCTTNPRSKNRFEEIWASCGGQ